MGGAEAHHCSRQRSEKSNGGQVCEGGAALGGWTREGAWREVQDAEKGLPSMARVPRICEASLWKYCQSLVSDGRTGKTRAHREGVRAWLRRDRLQGKHSSTLALR